MLRHPRRRWRRRRRAARVGGFVCRSVSVWLFERHRDLPMKSRRIYIPGGTTRRRRVRHAVPGGRMRASTLSTWCGGAVAAAAGVWKSGARAAEEQEMRVAGGAGDEWEAETPSGVQWTGRQARDEDAGMVGGRSSERERLPPFYSGADLHNDQRLSCLSKLFSAICIIFCRAGNGAKGVSGSGSDATGWDGERVMMRGRGGEGRGWTLLLSILECILCARLMKL